MTVARVAKVPVTDHVHNQGQCLQLFTLNFGRPVCTFPVPLHTLHLWGFVVALREGAVVDEDVPFVHGPPVLVEGSRNTYKPTSLSRTTF